MCIVKQMYVTIQKGFNFITHVVFGISFYVISPLHDMQYINLHTVQCI